MRGFHVVVAGGGALGVQTAARLARRGVQVTLVEPHALLGHTSSRSTQCYRRWPEACAEMNVLIESSVQLLREQAAATGAALSKNGYLFLSGATTPAADVMTFAKNFGGNVREHRSPPDAHAYRASTARVDVLWGRDTLTRAFGMPFGDAGAGVHLREAGWYDSDTLLAGLVRHHHLPVVKKRVADARVTSGRVVVSLSDGEELRCDHLVLAVGPALPQWLERLGFKHVPIVNEIHARGAFVNRTLPTVEAGLPLVLSRDPITPLWTEKQQAAMSPDQRRELVREFPAGLHWLRGEDHVKAIWNWERLLHQGAPLYDPVFTRYYEALLLASMARLFPEHFASDAAAMEFRANGAVHIPSHINTKVGYYTKCVENRPLVSKLVDGISVVGAFSGFGMMACAGAGELAAQIVTTEKDAPRSLVDAFSVERYRDPGYVSRMPTMVSGQL